MRAALHRMRGHALSLYPTLVPISAMWHHCSCGRKWLA